MARTRSTPRHNGFKISAKAFFLTYPQANSISRDELYEFLETFHGVNRLLVAEEIHQDGGRHFHCFVGFAGQISFRDPAKFDFKGCHPNIQAARSAKAVVAYCTKHGNWRAKNVDVKVKPDLKETLLECIEKGMDTPAVCMHFVEAGLVSTLVRSFTNIRGIVKSCASPSNAHDPVRSFPDDFKISGNEELMYRLEDWVAALPLVRRGERTEEVRSLWITGASRLGKSQLARSLAPHWYMQNMWMVDLLDDETALYGVLDDIDWDSLKRYYKAVLGMQTDVVLADKYRPKRMFKMGRPVIIITNELPMFSYEEKAWLDVNVEFFHVTNKLY